LQPRPTALSRAIATLANGGAYDHPVMDRPGWWRADSHRCGSVRPLLLLGKGEMRAALEECCKARRLAFISDDFGSLDQPSPQTAWSSIHALPAWPGEGKLRLICRYGAGDLLDLEAKGSADPRCVADACLDLLIDDCRGRVRLLKAHPANQYELSVAA
jgi:dTDP-4-dehydrorhamnose reductase